MAKILINRIQRANPQDRTKSKWYASIKSNSNVNLKTLSKRVKKNTTLAEGEVYLVLTEAATAIAECLLDGSTVSIDGLGSFRLTAQSEGTEKMEECTAACIKSVKVGFTAAESFKDQLKSATFTLASGMVTEK